MFHIETAAFVDKDSWNDSEYREVPACLLDLLTSSIMAHKVQPNGRALSHTPLPWLKGLTTLGYCRNMGANF